MRVIVVGHGLVGAAVALSLRRGGADVVVVERGVPGAEASAAAGGILSPQAECDEDGPFLRLCLRGLSSTRRLCRSLVDDDATLGLRDAGTLDVAIDDDGMAALSRRVAWQRAAGLEAVLLDAGAARALAPLLSARVVGGALFSTEASLDPRLLHDVLRRANEAAGVGVERALVEEVRAHAVVVRSEGAATARALEGDAVVVCAGAWTPQVRGVDVSGDHLYPVRGQIMCVQGPAPGELGAFAAVVYGAGGYVVPRLDGRVLAGSTMERVGFAKATTPAGLARIGAMLGELMPDLAERPVHSSWSGLRPATSDGLPLLGRTSDGVWVASGHFRNGVLLAGVSGELLAGALLRGETIDEAFSPRRCQRR